MMLRSFVALAAFMLAALPVATPADTTGSIAGFVRDARTGSPVSGVRLHANSPGKVMEAVTGRDGFYVLMDLDPGRYSIYTIVDGYSPEVALLQVSAGGQTFTRFEVHALTHELRDPFFVRSFGDLGWGLGFESPGDVYRLSPARDPLFANSTLLSDVLRFVPGVQAGGAPAPQ